MDIRKKLDKIYKILGETIICEVGMKEKGTYDILKVEVLPENKEEAPERPSYIG